MASFVLDIALDGDSFKIVWTGYNQLQDEPWTPQSYRVPAGLLMDAATAVRKQLRALAGLPERCEAAQFAPLIRQLARNGQDLFNRLLPASGGEGPDVDEIKQQLARAAASLEGHRPDLKVRLETDTLFVPWGFVFSGSNADLLRQPVGTIDDMKGFWLAQFCISVVYGGSPSFPQQRMPRSGRLLAIHQEMFSGARKELEKDCLERLDELLEDQPEATTDWYKFFEASDEVQDDHDTVLYVFGHSDGQSIQLSDGEDDQYALRPASMWRFKKRTKGTASIFILNGCRTAAPNPNSAEKPISANFLRATRQPGYYGFIGTEAQVSNVFACRYGTEFLWRLIKKRQSVGETFDELLHRRDLFPHNILYTCYADRAFCLASVSPGGRPT
jgi:hypothetical protein